MLCECDSRCLVQHGARCLSMGSSCSSFPRSFSFERDLQLLEQKARYLPYSSYSPWEEDVVDDVYCISTEAGSMPGVSLKQANLAV